MSTICCLNNPSSKLCRIDNRAAKWTFTTLSLKPIDSLVNLLATFRARHFQRQIVKKHNLGLTITKLVELAKLSLITGLIQMLEKELRFRHFRGFVREGSAS
jgi:hypothetical protein